MIELASMDMALDEYEMARLAMKYLCGSEVNEVSGL
jgi:hypothetical protein